MLLAEILFNIKNLKNGGVQDDDDRLSDLQLIYIYNYYRAQWSHQEYNKKGYGALASLEQNLFKTAMVDLKETEAIGSGLAIDNLSITEEIPRLIKVADKLAFSYVGSVDGTKPYQPITRGRMSLLKYARNAQGEGFFYPFNNRVVVRFPNDSRSKFLGLSGVFENPVEVKEFNITRENASTDPVGIAILDIDFNYDYPVSSHANASILQMINSLEVKLVEIAPKDDVNDSTDQRVVNA